MKNESAGFKVLTAHVEHSKARFSHTDDMGIEFRNVIDAWTKMEIVFREQIKDLRECGVLDIKPTKRQRKQKRDLNPLVYSFREKIG